MKCIGTIKVNGGIDEETAHEIFDRFVDLYNRCSDVFNAHISEWNSEWDSMFPDGDLFNNPTYGDEYFDFIRINAQPYLDEINSDLEDKRYECAMQHDGSIVIRLKSNHDDYVSVSIEEL